MDVSLTVERHKDIFRFVYIWNFTFSQDFPSPRAQGDPLNVSIILTNQRLENDSIGQSASRVVTALALST